MFKILHLISTSGFFGAENMMIELSKKLRSMRYEVYVGVIGNSYNSCNGVFQEAKKNNLGNEVFLCEKKFDIKTILGVRKFIKEKGITIVHSHGYKSNFYVLLASLNINILKVTTCHNWLSKSTKMKFYECLDRMLLNRFDKVVTVSDILKEKVLRSGVREERVTVINNGIDINRFKVASRMSEIKESLGIRKDEKVVGAVGRLTSEKGHIYLLKAFAKVASEFPDVKLLLVGDGSLRESLESGVRSMELKDKVIFTGVRNDIPEMLSIMDIFVLPSLIEGMPMVLLEAMSAQKPIIATNVGAIPKLIEDNKTGILIEPKDIEGISAAVGSILTNSERAKSFAINAFEKVNNEFSSSIMAQRYLEVYNEAIKNGRFS